MSENTTAIRGRDGRTERTTEAEDDAGEGLAARAPRPRPSGRALAGRRPDCEACGRPTSAGRGGEFGDETYGWLCESCAGELALAEYGVDAEGWSA